MLLAGLPNCFFLWWDFCCKTWFKHGSYIFILISLFVWRCPLPIFLITFNFSSLQAFLMLFWVDSLLYSFVVFFSLFIISMVHFSMLSSIPVSWLMILIDRIGFKVFWIFGKYLNIIHVCKMIKISYDFVNLLPPCLTYAHNGMGTLL